MALSQRARTAFLDLERAGAGGPAWLLALRRAALARFEADGLPTTRDEGWRYTNLALVEATAFTLWPEEAAGAVPEAVAASVAEAAPANRLVFVNGRLSAALSTLASSPSGLRVGSLAEKARGDETALRVHLEASGDTRSATSGEGGFAALTDAFWPDGAFLQVEAGVVIEDPVHLVFVASAPEAPTASQPRNLILLERGSRLTVVETYLAGSAHPSLTNALTELVLGEDAALEHYKVVEESVRAVHVGRTRIRHARDSRASSLTLTLGGRLVRHEVHAELEAAGAICSLAGLYVVGGRQHVDTHTVVDHSAPHGTSRQLYKGVLDGSAHGVFNGRVIVRPGAQKTDAHQSNKNLLLSDGVEVDSKPQLEIFADDVKCSHGAADGQLAEDAIFYLKSRGLAEAAARALLTHGFAHEVLARITVEALRARVERVLASRLQGGHVMEETA